MRVRLPDDAFVQLLNEQERSSEPQEAAAAAASSSKADVMLRNLKQLFVEECLCVNGGSKIALRMTRGPTNACVNFYCDGDYATATVQVALNDSSEYEGGRLCFFRFGEREEDDALEVLDRPAGSVCRHPRSVLHAVTSLTRGTRKSLFVVDTANGLGENGVIHASSSDVTPFLEARRRAALEEAKREAEQAFTGSIRELPSAQGPRHGSGAARFVP
jgi:hypothetical protein